jgi:hypothetical protein
MFEWEFFNLHQSDLNSFIPQKFQEKISLLEFGSTTTAKPQKTAIL